MQKDEAVEAAALVAELVAVVTSEAHGLARRGGLVELALELVVDAMAAEKELRMVPCSSQGTTFGRPSRWSGYCSDV
jgi:hypothetical protein